MKGVYPRFKVLSHDIVDEQGRVTPTPDLRPFGDVQLGGVAQFEREMMLERQREGIAKAKSAGKYKGRKPIALERQQHVLRLAAEGATKTSIARRLGIGEAAVYRILAVAKE
jgi:DNA invertase Pin-like site-specific DNA recombinase